MNKMKNLQTQIEELEAELASAKSTYEAECGHLHKYNYNFMKEEMADCPSIMMVTEFLFKNCGDRYNPYATEQGEERVEEPQAEEASDAPEQLEEQEAEQEASEDATDGETEAPEATEAEEGEGDYDTSEDSDEPQAEQEQDEAPEDSDEPQAEQEQDEAPEAVEAAVEESNTEEPQEGSEVVAEEQGSFHESHPESAEAQKVVPESRQPLEFQHIDVDYNAHTVVFVDYFGNFKTVGLNPLALANTISQLSHKGQNDHLEIKNELTKLLHWLQQA